MSNTPLGAPQLCLIQRCLPISQPWSQFVSSRNWSASKILDSRFQLSSSITKTITNTCFLMILLMYPLAYLENSSICYWTATTVLKAISFSSYLVFLLAMNTTWSALRMILLHFLYESSSSNYHPVILTYFPKIIANGTFWISESISKGFQEELFNFEGFLVWVDDFEVVFIIESKHQWAGWARDVSGLRFEEELELIDHWVKREIFWHGFKRAN